MGRRQWHPAPVLLPGKSHGCRGLVGCSPPDHYESDTTERLHFHFSLSCIGEGNGNPLQGSCLENPRGREAWWAAVCGVAQNQTWLKWLSSSSSSHIWAVATVSNSIDLQAKNVILRIENSFANGDSWLSNPNCNTPRNHHSFLAVRAGVL